nr:hypothetical protein [Tanacetum cinerariifolium]
MIPRGIASLTALHETTVKEVMEDPFVIDSRINSLGNVNLDELLKDHKNDDAEITFIGSSPFDQEMEEADFDLESMPDDEIMLISGDDNKEVDYDQELSTVDEKAADNILDKLINKENNKDANVFAATTNEKKNIHRVISNVQTSRAIRRFKEIQITKAPRETLRGFNRRIKNAIKDEMAEVLKEYVLKPINIEFNALNKLESQRFFILEKNLHKSLRNVSACEKHGLNSTSAKAIVEGEKESQEQPESTTTDNTQSTKVHAQLKGSHKPLIHHSSLFEYSRTLSSRMADKGKGIAQTSDGDKMKQVMPFMEEGGSTPSLANL